MKILITGICGFVGNALAQYLMLALPNCKIYGVDNFIRPGSEFNRISLKKLGVKIYHADIRLPSDLENLPDVDWVIEAAAVPSVLAGVDGKIHSRQLIEHNIYGTVNVLEFCKKVGAGFILLSTSRVYSISGLSNLEVEVVGKSYRPNSRQNFPTGIGTKGVSEEYSSKPPVSLYGASKIASETLSLEYGQIFDFPVWINRCGVLAGAGQFGRFDQGIFSYWIHSWKQKKPLKYIGFDGQGHQVRDCLHPIDIAGLITKQMASAQNKTIHKVMNVSGGIESAMSLRQLSEWCTVRFGEHPVAIEPENRPFDIPWMVLDPSLAKEQLNWTPRLSISEVLEEIATFAENNPHWLEISESL